LHTNTDEEDEKRAVREAGLDAVRIVNGTETTKQMNVDVDCLLHEPANGDYGRVIGLGDAGRGGAGAGANAGAGHDIVRRDGRGGGWGRYWRIMCIIWMIFIFVGVIILSIFVLILIFPLL